MRAAWLSTDPKRLAYDRIRTDTDVVFAAASAARLHGIGDLWDRHHDFITRTRRQSQRSEIRYRQRNLDPDDVVTVQGLPALSVEATVADLFNADADLRHIGNALRDAAYKRRLNLNATTAASYPVVGIADAEPIPFPGFDRLVLSHVQLQAMMREHRYASWRTALSSVVGIYLITDTRDGRHYVGKANGAESIRQRWNVYATNGHGGNVELRRRDPTSFRFSLLRVFDPSTPTRNIDAAESHFKDALDSRRHGLNRN